MIHNQNIVTFDDIPRHLELEDEQLEASKTTEEAFVTESSKVVASSSQKEKGSYPNGKKKFKNKANCGKCQFKKHLKNKQIKGFNYKKKGHFAWECTELKKVRPIPFVSNLFVSSCIFLVEFNPLWILDSGATHHVINVQEAFADFRQVLSEAQWIYVGNN